MITHNIKKVCLNYSENVENLEACLGVDHSQSTCVFLAAVIIRRKTIKDAHSLETPVGESDEDKDKIGHLIALTSKLNFGLDFLSINVDGC